MMNHHLNEKRMERFLQVQSKQGQLLPLKTLNLHPPNFFSSTSKSNPVNQFSDNYSSFFPVKQITFQNVHFESKEFNSTYSTSDTSSTSHSNLPANDHDHHYLCDKCTVGINTEANEICFIISMNVDENENIENTENNEFPQREEY